MDIAAAAIRWRRARRRVSEPDEIPNMATRDGDRDAHTPRPARQGRREFAGKVGGKVAKLYVGAGRKLNIRPGDIVGAIAGEAGLGIRKSARLRSATGIPSWRCRRTRSITSFARCRPARSRGRRCGCGGTRHRARRGALTELRVSHGDRSERSFTETATPLEGCGEKNSPPRPLEGCCSLRVLRMTPVFVRDDSKLATPLVSARTRVAPVHVIVHESGGLHERVHRGRADKPPAALLEIL